MALFNPSTAEEIRACQTLIEQTRQKIAALTAQGKYVHIIWDVDGVLTSSRSDAVFARLGFDVEKYFAYEERLFSEHLEDGSWAGFARSCGQAQRQHSQDIVTARSSFLYMRVTFWLLNWRIPIRWQLSVGHQSKKESYRIILQSFVKNQDAHVFMVDDGAKHVQTFNEVAAELGMIDRCHGIIAPVIRDFDDAEIDREIEAVMTATGERFVYVDLQKPRETLRRAVMVAPNPHEAMRSMYMGLSVEAHIKATVDSHRAELTEYADRIWPGQKHSDMTLYSIYEKIMSP
jgi:hypothetical protein